MIKNSYKRKMRRWGLPRLLASFLSKHECRRNSDQVKNPLHEVTVVKDGIYNSIAVFHDPATTSLAALPFVGQAFALTILLLEWSEVHFESLSIRLSAQKTKSMKSRIIPITPSVMDILQSMKSKYALVVGNYTDNILRKQWIKLLNIVKFNKIGDGTRLHFHDLRHIYAQTLLDQGVSLEDIQTLLGHESFDTTQKRYAMFARPDLQEKAGRIDNVIKLKKIG